MAITNLGWHLTFYGRWEEAEHYSEHSLDLTTEAFGSQHPFIATSLFNLGWLRLCERNMAEAESLLRRCLAMRIATLGKDHKETYIGKCGLACLLVQQGDNLAARQLFDLGQLPIGDHPISDIQIKPAPEEPWHAQMLKYQQTVHFRESLTEG